MQNCAYAMPELRTYKLSETGKLNIMDTQNCALFKAFRESELVPPIRPLSLIVWVLQTMRARC